MHVFSLAERKEAREAYSLFDWALQAMPRAKKGGVIPQTALGVAICKRLLNLGIVQELFANEDSWTYRYDLAPVCGHTCRGSSDFKVELRCDRHSGHSGAHSVSRCLPAGAETWYDDGVLVRCAATGISGTRCTRNIDHEGVCTFPAVKLCRAYHPGIKGLDCTATAGHSNMHSTKDGVHWTSSHAVIPCPESLAGSGCVLTCGHSGEHRLT